MFKTFFYRLCTHTEPDTAELAAVGFYFAASLFSLEGETCPESTGDHAIAGVESPHFSSAGKVNINVGKTLGGS